MTVLTMAWALKKAPVPDDPLAHLVLIGLADHANDDGTGAFPSVRTLAGYARCTPRTVQAKLRVLEAASLIRRGDQHLVERFPANRRPVVWDLVVDGGGSQPFSPAPVEGGPENGPGRSRGVGVVAGQVGVKILHPKDRPVDNVPAGVSTASPQNDSPVDNPGSGVNAGSPLSGPWGERPGRSGVNVSSYKPPIEEPHTGRPPLAFPFGG